jgi:CheY-like chemotaxis protein
MDLNMPECDGFTAAREIQRLAERASSSLGRRRAPPIVALTASAFPEDRRRCLDAGMVDYLAKPFTCGELEAVLKRCLPAQPRKRHSA